MAFCNRNDLLVDGIIQVRSMCNALRYMAFVWLECVVEKASTLDMQIMRWGFVHCYSSIMIFLYFFYFFTFSQNGILFLEIKCTTKLYITATTHQEVTVATMDRQ